MALVAVLAVMVTSCSMSIESGSSDSTTTSTARAGTGDQAGQGPDDPTTSTIDPPPDAEEPETDDRAEDSGPVLPREPAEGDLTRDEVLALIEELPGQLAIGNGPVVAVARPDGLTYTVLDGGSTRLASQPTWSHDGLSLIWSSVSTQAGEARIQRFDDEGLPEGPVVISSVPGMPIFYFQWSADDESVVYLRKSSRRQTLEGGVLTPGAPARWLTDADPFFLAWAPSGSTIAAHLEDERLVTLDSADAVGFDDLDPNRSDPEVPVSAGGGFSAPAWIDDDTLLAVVDGALSRVDVGTGTVVPLLELSGPARFVLSPDRTKVAIQIAGRPPDEGPLEVGVAVPAQATDGADNEGEAALVVVDLSDGNVTTVTDEVALAWEWSPDSDRVAWLSLIGPPVQRSARWRFWSADGAPAGDETSPVFRVSVKEVVNYFPFFAQYSHSITRWSPDSSAFVFAGSIGRSEGVWVHPVDRPGSSVLVASGDFVTWGSGPTPAPAGGRSPA